MLQFLCYHLTSSVYSLYFHPLCQIPGPWYAAITRIPYIRAVLKGTTAEYLRQLHAKYGDVVRYTPNEISVISGETAWSEIYGFRTGKSKGVGTFEKDLVWYSPGVDNVDSMIRAQTENHGRQRRTLSHAFSTQALKDQERLIQGYVDLLITRLKETNSDSNASVDICMWYNWTTFDVIADLVFGEPFGCLADLATHEYVQMILDGIAAFRLYYVKMYWPWVKYLGSLLVDPSVVKKREDMHAWVKAQTQKRISSDTERPDFMSLILSHRTDNAGKSALTDAEIASNAVLLLAAGTETSATTLSVTTYALLKNPEKMAKLVSEVRSCFKSQDEINFDSANGLPYLSACLNETLRWRAPVPAGFIRKVPSTGAEVSGYFIPGDCNASISMSQHIAYRSERNFKDPNEFVPERWLDDPRYADDNKASYQPFSFGPRSCLGKNLAQAELHVILAKMIFNFDMELDEKSRDWDKNMINLVLWHRPQLLIKLKEVQRA
ncbi:cytochrome P450 monooxygenase [Delphinella strobiligena]|nr:cytochrome P450 monooxygenase [Delphinella strobiligena]